MPLVWETPRAHRKFAGSERSAIHVSPPNRLSTNWRRRRKRIRIEFRLKMLMAGTAEDDAFRRARSIAVLKTAAEDLWLGSRVLRRKPAVTAEILTGRGIAYAFRGQTIVAEIAEVEVNRRTGHVWVKRLVCAHDCGLVVNPQSLRHSIECAMLHRLSRALHEEVQFDTEKVTSVDWITHPTLTHADTPAQNRRRAGERRSRTRTGPDLPPLRSGRDCLQTDDCGHRQCHPRRDGVRLRRVPFPGRAGARRAKGCRRLPGASAAILELRRRAATAAGT